MSAPVSSLSILASLVWLHGLRDRGANPFVIAARLERKLGQVFDAQSVSIACRELVSAGHADRSPFGYRARQVRQRELGVAA